MKPSSEPESPHHITKRAKAVLAGLFAVVVIGGVAAHHIHYTHMPQSVNLKTTVNDHVYHWSIPNVSDGPSGSDYFGGVFRGADMANSDVAISQGSVKGYSLSNNNSDSDNKLDGEQTSDQMGYELTPGTFTLSDQGRNSSDSSDSDGGNYVKYRLHSFSHNHKHLVLYPYQVKNKNQNDGISYHVSNKDAKKDSLILNEKKTLHTH